MKTSIIVDLAKNSITEPILREDFEMQWNQHVNEYNNKLKLLFQELIETRKNCKASRRISQFERESVAETSAKRFLRGIRRTDFVQVAKSICMHSPALEILVHAEQRGFEVAIISLSWSRDMISGCICKNHHISICSNDLEFDSNQVSTGKILATIFCGVEKMEQLNRLKEEKHMDQVIYVGDSLGDILPMLAANIGILFNPSIATLNLCNIFEVPMRPLSELLEEWRKDDCEIDSRGHMRNISKFKGNIFTAGSWHSIQSFLDLL